MTLVVPNAGEARELELIVNKSAQADLVLGLFANNVTPTNATVLGDLTEPSGGGYATKTLTGASWTVTPGTPSEAAYALQTFTFSGVPTPATIYGYYVKHGTVLLWAERLASPPFTVTGAGDEVKVTPKHTLGSVSGD